MRILWIDFLDVVSAKNAIIGVIALSKLISDQCLNYSDMRMTSKLSSMNTKSTTEIIVNAINHNLPIN